LTNFVKTSTYFLHEKLLIIYTYVFLKIIWFKNLCNHIHCSFSRIGRNLGRDLFYFCSL